MVAREEKSFSFGDIDASRSLIHTREALTGLGVIINNKGKKHGRHEVQREVRLGDPRVS